MVWDTMIESGGLRLGDEISMLCELELINAGPKDLVMKLDSTTEAKKK